MLSRLKALLAPQRLPTVDGPDYRPLAAHPHFETYVTLEPHFPDDGPAAIRSWFGGKPQMPADTPWPKDDAGRPCLFLAQICCADLPPDLWGGAGSIDGWLLFFMAPEALEPKVIHIGELGPERHEDCGLDRTHWEWNTREDLDIGTPRFRKFPVRPVAQTMPSDLALPKREQPEAPPLRPRTWGQLDLILSWLENELAPPKPVSSNMFGSPAKRAFDHRNAVKAEDPERRALRESTEPQWDQVQKDIQAARADMRKAVQKRLSAALVTDPATPLLDSEWDDFLAWASELKRPTHKERQLAPSITGEYKDHVAPFCQLWRPSRTKKEFMTQLSYMKLPRWMSFDSTEHAKLRRQKERAERGFGPWNEILEALLEKEAENASIAKTQWELLNDYRTALQEFENSIRHLADEDEIDPRSMQDFIDRVHKTEHFARFVETVRPAIPPITEFTLAFDDPLIPGLTPQCLHLGARRNDVYRLLGQSMIDELLAGTLPPEAVSEARAYAAHAHNPGRTMGGLPFFGHHEPNVMDLQAYASPAQRAALDDPMNRAVYGHIEKMEPQCLLLNLGSHDPVGWLWGDCYTLTIHMPRADLEAGRFDRVTGFIDNG